MEQVTDRQREIELMLTPSCRNYSAKMAETDLERITYGYYHLDGYTHKYIILGLREMVISALDLFLGCR